MQKAAGRCPCCMGCVLASGRALGEAGGVVAPASEGPCDMAHPPAARSSNPSVLFDRSPFHTKHYCTNCPRGAASKLTGRMDVHRLFPPRGERSKMTAAALEGVIVRVVTARIASSIRASVNHLRGPW